VDLPPCAAHTTLSFLSAKPLRAFGQKVTQAEPSPANALHMLLSHFTLRLKSRKMGNEDRTPDLLTASQARSQLIRKYSS
jgi:hypothetical protein